MTNKLTNALLSRRSSLPTGKRFLNKRLLAFLFVALSAMFSTSQIFAQAPTETIYKNWLRVGESETHVDVSARIIKCGENSSNQVHLFIFNEGSENTSIAMKVTITNNNGGQSFSTNVTKIVERATMIQANCEADSNTDVLKINLPESYDPNELTITVTFN